METALTAVRASGRPLISISGPTGIGRTTFLARLGAELTESGVPVNAVRFTREGLATPVSVGDGARPSGLAGLGPVWSPIGLAAGAADDPGVCQRAAVAAGAALLRGNGESALLVDDAQWTDRDSLAVLEALVRRLAGSPTICVCAIRTPAASPVAAEGLAVLGRLRQADLVYSVRLPSWTAAQIARRVVELVEAEPDRELVDHVRAISRGIPAAVDEAIQQLLDAKAIRTFSGRAHVVQGRPRSDPGTNRFRTAVRDLGADAWAVAKAVARLAPLGDDMPTLVSDALGMPVDRTRAALAALSAEGLLHQGRRWRFPLPHLESALVASLGPFERRQLAAHAVEAVWDGSATCADPDHLADLVADAGRLIDPARARGVLLDRAAGSPHERALSWFAAAVELTEDRADRAGVLFQQAVALHETGQHEQSLRAAELLLTSFAELLSPGDTQELQLIRLCASRAVGDVDILHEIADASAQHPVTRALALGLLDNWADAQDLLRRTRARWLAENPVATTAGGLLSALAALWTGDLASFEANIEAREDWPVDDLRRIRDRQTAAHASALLLIGDLTRAEKLLIDEDLPASRLPSADRAMLAVLRGEIESAGDIARRGVASGANPGYDVASIGMHRQVSAVLVAQGRLTAAREELAVARLGMPRMPHLLDIAEATIDRALGENERAIARLKQGLAECDDRGLVLDLDICLAELAELALATGDRALARQCRVRIEQVAERLPTGRAVVFAWLVRATVDGEVAAAAECERVARERGQPFELALVLERLVRHGVSDPRLLSESYARYGELGALLYRAWLRNLMRERGVVVPGRQETLAENERLLAMLAAQGLSNKQLAVVLRTSEKSVEGRLGRLFVRTGYRSRIELAAAMLSGRCHV